MGMAAATRGNPLRLSKANVRLNPDGTAIVRMAMTDIGTGTYTILAQIAAEMLGLPVEQVRVELGDTDFPEAAGSGGSFGAGSSGSALFEACQALREKLAQLAHMDPQTARFNNGSIESGEHSIRLAELVGSGVEADGEIRPGRNNKDFSQQSYGAHFAEVVSTRIPARCGCAACSASSPPAVSSTPRRRARRRLAAWCSVWAPRCTRQ